MRDQHGRKDEAQTFSLSHEKTRVESWRGHLAGTFPHPYAAVWGTCLSYCLVWMGWSLFLWLFWGSCLDRLVLASTRGR